MKILIDSVYIHNGGGKELLEIILNQINQKGLKKHFFFLFDKRFNINHQLTNNIKFDIIAPSEIKRKIFYESNKNKFKSYVCLSNVPPPIHIFQKVNIYFHNELFLKPFLNNLSFKNQLKLFLKKYYIIIKNKESYNWNVQTDLMSNNLSKTLRINEKKIRVYPFYNDARAKKNLRVRNSFLYVSNSAEHKNHKRLFLAFQEAASRTNEIIQLGLTLNERDFINSPYSNKDILSNLKIINYGVVEKIELSSIYSKSNFLIYPSLNESFGLPLIESINHGCYVIASDLKYVKQIVIPTLTFNPKSIKSIADSILQSLNLKKLNKSKILVNNKIDSFINHIM